MDGFFVFQTKIVQKVCSSALRSAPQAARQASSSRNSPNTALPEPVIAAHSAPWTSRVLWESAVRAPS